MLKDYQKFCKTVWNDQPIYRLQVSNACMGLCGEAGELTDLVKKFIHHNHSLDHDGLMKEIGDVSYYLVTVCNLFNIDLEMCIKMNEEKLRKRYPNGFNTKDSIERKDVK